MADRYNTTIKYEARDKGKPDDVPPDVEVTIIWRDLPYSGNLRIEGGLIAALADLARWTEENVNK